MNNQQGPIAKVVSLQRGAALFLLILGATDLAFSPATAAPIIPVVTVSNVWSHTGVKPGGEIALAVILDIREGFHISANTAQAPFVRTSIEPLSVPDGVRGSTPTFPKPQVMDFGIAGAKERISVFSKRAVVFVPIALNNTAQPGQAPIRLKITYQACDDQKCLMPTSVEDDVQLTIVDPKLEVKPLHEELFRELNDLRSRVAVAFFGWDFAFKGSNLWLLLSVAAVGGMLLNFTPCVLPLVPIKIMGLSRAAGNPSRCRLLGGAMSLGMIAFWIALAIAIRSISGFGAANKLFQYPAFTIGVGVVICVMAVGMCGFFSINPPSWVTGVNPSQETAAGSFLFGIMAAILSTPCTAPLMGAAAAWATTQSTSVSVATFAAIGFGMAMPYFLLSAFPVLVHRVPKTGPASELIKQTMGLLLLAAGAYFLGTGLAGLFATPPDPPTQSYWWAVALLIAIAGGWVAWRTLRIATSAVRRALFVGVGILLIAIGATIGFRFTRGSPVHWIYYTPERLAQALVQRKVVVLDFTAAWCLNCRFLEEGVLHNQRVVKLLNSLDVAPIKVDITGNNPAGDRKLLEVGRRSIPYLVVYSRTGEEVFSSDAYSVEQLVDSIESVALRVAGISQ